MFELMWRYAESKIDDYIIPGPDELFAYLDDILPLPIPGPVAHPPWLNSYTAFTYLAEDDYGPGQAPLVFSR